VFEQSLHFGIDRAVVPKLRTLRIGRARMQGCRGVDELQGTHSFDQSLAAASDICLLKSLQRT
jgi:hypothetical protein